MIILTSVWNSNFILLSFVFSFVGSYIGVCLSEQYRLCLIEGPILLTKNQILWLLSFSVAGVAIWSMHFIGMGALKLSIPDSNSNITVNFDTGLTVASFIAPIICLYVGLHIATNDRAFTRDSEEFGELLIQDAKNFSIKEAKKKSNLKRLALFKGLKPIIIGGIFTGAGVCVMHYIGMTAMVFEGTMSWDIGIIAASVIIAEVVSIIALWIIFRLLPLYPGSELLRVASAGVMGVAVCGMHYTGMNAATYYTGSDTHRMTSSLVIGSSTAVLSALFIGMVLMCVCLIFTAADMRARSSRTSKTLRGIDNLLNTLKSLSSHLPDEVNAIMVMYDKIVPRISSGESRRRDTFTNIGGTARRLSGMFLPLSRASLRTFAVSPKHQLHSLQRSSTIESEQNRRFNRQSSNGRYCDSQESKYNDGPRGGSLTGPPPSEKASKMIVVEQKVAAENCGYFV